MSSRRLRLALTRERLIERSGRLRNEAAAQSVVLLPALEAGDRVREGVQWLRVHPQIVAATLVGLAVVRPRRVWRWGLRAWAGWRLLQQLQQRVAGR
jgi:hypothetical protein